MQELEWVLPDTQPRMASGSRRQTGRAAAPREVGSACLRRALGAVRRGGLVTGSLTRLSQHSALIQVANEFHHLPCQGKRRYRD